MIVAESIERVREAVPIAGPTTLVPTMGALHAGHCALLETARASPGQVVLSLFVNPMQFAPGEDLDRYPRTLAADLEVAERAGVDVVFAPGVPEMFPAGSATRVDPGPLADELCGRGRPEHFAAVATVVAKLFGIVRPQRALFGEKDYQQLTILRRMSIDLNLNVSVEGVPTIRDPDGLALSSRNVFLSLDERHGALTLSSGLRAASAAYAAGERGSYALLEACRHKLAVAPEYIELRDLALGPYDPDEPAVMLLAARLGSTRLIDNVILRGTP